MLPKPEEGRFRVSFWGTRGSIATPGAQTRKYGGNTPCVYVQYGSDAVILDAGTGIRLLGQELANNIAVDGASPQHILLSHTHWDHIQGLPFFAPAYIPGCELRIYGSPRKESALAAILHDQMDNNYFPVKMDDLAAQIAVIEVEDETIGLGEITITTREQFCHPGGSVAFRLSAGGKTVVYSTDVELNMLFEPDVESEEAALRAEDYRRFISGADLLIADGQYTAEEYVSKRGWGHTSVPLLLRIAHEQGVKQLVVTHHDPDHSDDFIDNLQKKVAPIYRNADPPMSISWATEGTSIAV
jgi:phosphoribosyl 1,2-cyclic phosphodiesterase